MSEWEPAEADEPQPSGRSAGGPGAGRGGAGGSVAAAAFGPRRRSPLAVTLLIVAALSIVLSSTADLWTEVLWYDSVGFKGVFFTELWSKVFLGVTSGALTAALVASSIVIGYRSRPIYPPSTPQQEALDRYREALEPLRRLVTLAAPLLVGALVGLGAASQWQTFLLWRNGQNFGQVDPYFGQDLGFFIFTLPWLSFLVALLTVVLLAAAFAAGFTHYVYGGLQLSGPNRQTTSAARIHLSVLLAALVLVRAVAYWLERFELSNQSSTLMTGVQYTGATAVLPAKAILSVASVICAALFLAVIFTKTWRLPVVGVALLIITSVVVGGIYPGVIQSLKVKPSEKSLEAPYLDNHIKATRAAYGLDGVEVTQYQPKTNADPAVLRSDAASLPGIRLVDPNVVAQTFQQFQGLRGYYRFPDTLDVDRYLVDGKEEDAVVAARELDLTGVPSAQRNWLNDHTVFTHGYGVVVAYGTRRGTDGEPVFIEQDIPTRGKLGEFEPRIYFGEQSPEYSVVGGPSGGQQRELDYAASGGDKMYTYTGRGGVAVGSFARQVAYALKYRELNFLLSDAVTDESRLLDYRTPRERVQRVAPWLNLDGNIYPTVVDGRVLWVVDGYTTSDMYPNSSLASVQDATEDTITETRKSVAAIQGGQINYIRNSVKATVDAYDGTVTLYAWDETDPILRAWSAAFPGTVTPKSQMSAGLMAHVRYPEDLFKVQRQLLSKFHVTSADQFYGGQDFWKVPVDPAQESKLNVQPPYYLTVNMPGQSAPSFSLTTAFVPNGKDVLSGFLSVDSDAGATAGSVRPGYGALRLLALPKDSNVNGPGQVENYIGSSNDNSPRFSLTLSGFINLNKQQGSTVTMGNLLTLPVGGGLLYVQPIYVQAKAEPSYPLSKAIVTVFGSKLTWSDTLDGALTELFGASTNGNGGTGTGQTPGGGTTTPPTGDLAKALADVQTAYAEGEAAFKKGDWAAYGAAQTKLKAAIEKALALQRGAGPGGTGSLTPTASATTTATTTATSTGG